MNQSQAEQAVRRRQMFFIAGYELLPPVAHYNRFVRQLEIFERTWGTAATASSMRQGDRQLSWSVEASGANWQTHTVWEFWSWDHIVRADNSKHFLWRLGHATIAYLDLLFTGTIFRYLSANARYLFFALVPPLAIGLFGIVALVAGIGFAQALQLTGAARIVIIAATGVSGFFLLLRWPGRRWRIEQALDDWIFTHSYMRGRRRDVDARLETFAARLVVCARECTSQEIVIVGHSLGATLALDVVARALALDPDLGRHGTAVNILTLGATIPKNALHPAANRTRQAIHVVVAEPSIHWAEIHSRGDAISFYKFDPAMLRKIDVDKLAGKPVIRRVQIHDMLQPRTYSRIKMRVLRMHYQSVSANDRRSKYDYFMMALGPVPFRRWIVSPDGLLDFFEASSVHTVHLSGVAS